MNSADRYIRQTSLKGFGKESQKKLAHSRVLIVGLGGLGIPVAQYLNAMGVGTLGLVEQDVVALHNLQRQVLYSEKDVQRPKLEVALEKLKNQNTGTRFKPFDTFLTKDNALGIIKEFDLVIDATDNFATRYLINDACIMLNKPFVYGALHAFEGQVSVFNYKNGPTYRCLYPEQPKSNEVPNCDENGVLGVLPGIVGTLQALEAVKVLTEVGEVLSGKLLLYDGLTQTTQKINFEINPEYKKIKNLQDSYGFSSCEKTVSISSEEFVALYEKSNIQIIDVRSVPEFENYNLKNSSNIPLPQLESSFTQIDFTRPVYLLCQSGKRSIAAFETLKVLHPKATLFNIEGGLANISAHVGAK